MKRVAKVIWTELLPMSPVFSTADVMKRTGMKLANTSRDLRNLEAHGAIRRVRRGLWAVLSHPDFSPYAVVPHLFAGEEVGYVSLLSALSLHGMMEQIPQAIHIVTTAQRQTMKTPVGTYQFFQVEPGLFGGYQPYRRTGSFDIATPEKAVFDTLYFSARKGRRFSFLPEIELTAGFSSSEVEHWINQIRLQPLRTAVRIRWESLAQRLRGGTQRTTKRNARVRRAAPGSQRARHPARG